jgi:prevent-host-death family protein
MRTVNMHEAKTHLSRLVEGAVNGESFIIARAGKPLVKVTSIEEPEKKPMRRIGFLKGQYIIPDDLTAMDAEIEEMFYGSKE